MILDKLMEIKDLNIYCRLRIEELHKQKMILISQFTPNMSRNKKKKLNHGINMIRGRIRELKTIKGLNHDCRGIKKQCKKMWRAGKNDVRRT